MSIQSLGSDQLAVVALEHLFRLESGEVIHPDVPEGWEVSGVRIEHSLRCLDIFAASGRIFLAPKGTKKRARERSYLPLAAEILSPRSAEFQIVVLA